jgi:hypothetical protein
MMLSIVLLQIVIPLALIALLFKVRRHSLLAWVLFNAGTVTYIAAIATAGVWLALPWYTGLLALSVVALAVLWRAGDVRTLRWRPIGRFARAETAVAALLVAGAGALFVESVGARQAPSEFALNLSFPLHGGSYYVANGGSRELTNAHVKTLHDERFRGYRGQSYAVDIVRIDGRGLRASGLAPGDLTRYVSVGEPVLAPCNGQVLALENAAPDMPPPQADRTHMPGNFVLLDCGPAQVLVGHLQQGSVSARLGQAVAAGQHLGALGNSGNTGEPHLHIHAQRPTGSMHSLLDADPVPVTFYGRALARNDVVRTGAVPPPAMTETQLLYAQLGSTVVALFMLIVSVRRRTAGRVLFSLLFAWAAIINARLSSTSPVDYLGYASFTFSDLYRSFIFGFFAQHTDAIVTAIAVGQAWIAVALLRGVQWQRMGLAGAITFLLAIAPLGIGSGFPATLIMAVAAGVLWREPATVQTVRIVPARLQTEQRAA